MTSASAPTRRPTGIVRWWLRAPLALYRVHVGRYAVGEMLLYLSGKPHVRVAHRGRRSGEARQAVLEVLETDRETGEIRVAAMWGPESDWFRNIQAAPAVEIEVRRRRFPPSQRFLPEPEAQSVLDRYRARHPVWSRLPAVMIRRPFDAAAMPVVGFTAPGRPSVKRGGA